MGWGVFQTGWFSHAPSLQNASIYAGVMYDMGVLSHHVTTETFSLYFRATPPMESGNICLDLLCHY